MLTRVCNTKVVFVLHEQVRKRIALISPPLPAWSIYIFVVICFCSELYIRTIILVSAIWTMLHFQEEVCSVIRSDTVLMTSILMVQSQFKLAGQHGSNFNTVSMRISHTFCFEAMDHWPNVAHDSQVSASQLQNDSAAMRNDQATRRAESNDE